MEFAPEYFKGEVRDGFYVQPLMKRAWAAQLEVLAEIDRICEKYQIKYIATWGTLLGAIRHKGFIPWDDDMDLGMLREDYEKFLHYVKKELPKGWRFLDHKNDNYGELLARIINTTHIDLSSEFLNRYHGCPFSVGVDIFPIDNVPDDKKEEEDLIYVMQVLAGVGYNLEKYEKEEGDLEPTLRKLEKITGQKVDRTKSLKSQLLHLADRVSAMYWDEKTKDTAMIWMLMEEPDCKIPRACFDKIIRIPFENTTVPVIEDYDLMLRRFFDDDYMETRIYTDHTYPFMLMQMSALKDFYKKLGAELPACYHVFGRVEDQPLISVIISCHNAGAYVDRCLQSLMCQTVSVTSLEIICIDNASTDETLERLQEWEKKLEDYMVIVACDESGTECEVKNTGLGYATADYVAFMDADDWVEMDYFEKLYYPAEENAFDVLNCACRNDASGRLTYFKERETGKENRAFLIDNEQKRKAFIGLQSIGSEISGKLIRKEFLEEHGICFTEQDGGEKRFAEMLYLYANRIYLHEEELYHRHMI